ncbi:hypothetical protein [Actinosynnema sp. NPDC020468]|uniref:hypothetical protein n=1 Tax=Actinosynnema sp. NPDC020468 TaxID=3154488 RepID=UPI00340484C1
MTALDRTRSDPLLLAAAPLAVGVGLWLFLRVGGRMSATELVALALAPPAVLVLARLPRGRSLLLLALLWLLGLTFATLANGGEPMLVARNVANVVVLVATVALLVAVLRVPAVREGWSRDVLIAGFGVGELVGLVLTPPEATELGLWKFGAGQALTVCVFVAAQHLRVDRTRLVLPLIALGLCGLHLALGARSLALLTLVLAVAGAVVPTTPRPGSGRRLLLVVVLGFTAIAAYALQRAYSSLAVRGLLGLTEQMKIGFQDGDFGVLVGGRKDFVFLVSAVWRNPITGWGPGAVVPSDVKSAAVMWLQGHGYPVRGYDWITFVMPDSLYLHSTLLGAWVTAGVLAVPFVLLCVGICAKGLVSALRRRSFAEAYVVLAALWHLFFSPLGDSSRGHIAFAVALGLVALAAGQPKHRAHGRRSRAIADRATGRR